MKKPLKFFITLTLLGTTVAQAQAPATQTTQPAQAAQAASQLPASWNNATLANATYVILEPRLEGNTSLLNAEQQKGILDGLKRDSAGAIQRRYPNAHFAADPATPGAITVQPVMVVPSALVPWARVDARLNLKLPEGNQVALVENFSVLTLWQQSWNAANYAFDQMVKKLP